MVMRPERNEPIRSLADSRSAFQRKKYTESLSLKTREKISLNTSETEEISTI
jgi:hypothetical protein